MKSMSNKPTANHLRTVTSFAHRRQNSFATSSRLRHAMEINPSRAFDSISETLKRHWPEYLMEAWGLGLFLISACAFAVLLQHPRSPVPRAIPDATLRQS